MSSLPKKPIFPLSEWNKELIKKISGRWGKVGFHNRKSLVGVFSNFIENDGSIRFYYHTGKGKILFCWIDSPNQIIKIGPKLNPPKF